MKNKKNNFRLLTISVFLHLISCFCASYLDMKTQSHWHLSEVNYWLNFFSWWSVQASLITVIYFIYRLFKKSSANYFDKVFDLIVINANVISISIFSVAIAPIFWGGKPWTATPSKGGPINIFFFVIDRKIFWWFYALIWHYLTPVLTIIYFVRKKFSLAQTYYKRRELFLYSFLHPFFYLIFVLLRPLVPGAEKYPFGKSKYPYFFFNWIGGNKYSGLLWGLVAISVIFFFLFAFWFSTLFFWWYSGHKLKNLKTRKRNILEKSSSSEEIKHQ